MTKKICVGVVGVSGYGGGELLRYLAYHPHFKLTYACAEANAGKNTKDIFPGLPEPMWQKIEKWDHKRAAETVELLFLSLPTGKSREIALSIPNDIRVVDLGGDHRFVDGWTYGLPDIRPHELSNAMRVANPGCYPTAAILALAPLLANTTVCPKDIVITAVSGLSGTGRGDKKASVFADMNEDSVAYGFLNHPHVPEIEQALSSIAQNESSITFVPQYIPMTRGISVVCVAKGYADKEQCIAAAREYYKDRAFIRVVDKPPHTKHAAGSNLAFISYSANESRLGKAVALATIDNLGKGAAGQAVQSANLMYRFPETAGLQTAPLWP